jgi:hypothetical protein
MVAFFIFVEYIRPNNMEKLSNLDIIHKLISCEVITNVSNNELLVNGKSYNELDLYVPTLLIYQQQIEANINLNIGYQIKKETLEKYLKLLNGEPLRFYKLYEASLIKAILIGKELNRKINTDVLSYVKYQEKIIRNLISFINFKLAMYKQAIRISPEERVSYSKTDKVTPIVTHKLVLNFTKRQVALIFHMLRKLKLIRFEGESDLIIRSLTRFIERNFMYNDKKNEAKDLST